MNKIALRIGIYKYWNNLYYRDMHRMDPRHPLPFWDSLKRTQYLFRLLRGFKQSSVGRVELHQTREVIDIYVCHDRYIYSPISLNMKPLRTICLPDLSANSRTTLPNNYQGLGSNPGGELQEHNSYIAEKRKTPKGFIQINSEGGAASYPIPPKQATYSAARQDGNCLKDPCLTLSNPNSGVNKVWPLPNYKLNILPLRLLLNILKTRIQIFNLYSFPIDDVEWLSKFLLSGTFGGYINKKRLNALKRLLKLGIIKGVKIKIQGRYKKSTRSQNEVYQFGNIPNSPTTNLKIKLFYTSRLIMQPLGSSSLHIYIVYPHTR